MTKLFQRALIFLLTTFLTALLITTPAIAEGDSMDKVDTWADVAEEIDEAPGYEDPKDKQRKWTLSLGVVAGVSPDYEGSDNYDFGMGPNIAFSWRDIIFYKGKTLGANLVRKKSLKAGPVLSWASGRDEDDNDRLEGLGDVDSSVEAGGFVTYRNKPFRFRLEARQDLNSGHEGALVELSGGATLPFKKPLVLVSLGTTWASDDYMESFFGIDAEQAADSGLRKFKADAGFKDVSFGVTSGYSISSRWRIGGKIEWKRLVGDAADSPIVDDKNQFLAGISLSYHMGSKIVPEDLQLQ